jgi:hypothetical protein
LPLWCTYIQGREGYSAAGIQYYTQFYMGGIHPRPKQTVGRRLALAAKAIAYGDAETVYTGPVIKSCTVYPGELREKRNTKVVTK